MSLSNHASAWLNEYEGLAEWVYIQIYNKQQQNGEKDKGRHSTYISLSRTRSVLVIAQEKEHKRLKYTLISIWNSLIQPL